MFILQFFLNDFLHYFYWKHLVGQSEPYQVKFSQHSPLCPTPVYIDLWMLCKTFFFQQSKKKDISSSKCQEAFYLLSADLYLGHRVTYRDSTLLLLQ